jgi:UDP-N-acetylmuramyl pentapeptide phosphotransferase/UDP-N-acetylglucosamine-1-phosphate transferase
LTAPLFFLSGLGYEKFKMNSIFLLPAYFAPLLAFTVTWLAIVLLLRTGLAKIAMDDPNPRSLHVSPIPRSGGVAIMAGVLAGWSLILPHWLWLPLGLGVTLAAVSLIDDIFGLAAGWRLLAHALAAVALVAAILGHYPLWVCIPAILAIVWMTNLYNFMDGSDGLAGGMTLFGFGAYGLAAWWAHDAAFALVAWSIATAAAGFLIFNFHPARIFMGDAGSVPLGFLAAALGVIGWQRGLWPWWFAPLVFSSFVVDASVTLAKRLLRREKIWQAHREHYYQQLVRMGCGHRNTALLEYALMLAICASALWGVESDATAQAGLLVFWCAVYFVAMRLIDIKWAKIHATRKP